METVAIQAVDREVVPAAVAPEVSLVVAVQNQQGLVTAFDLELHRVLDSYGAKYEIIYVDDGSIDGTYSELRRLAAERPEVRLLKLRTAFGEASVLEAGLEAAQGEKLLFSTCRVRVTPNALLDLLKVLDAGSDLVIGVRHPRRDSRLNQFVSRLFNALTNRLTHLKLHDINSGVMAMRRSVRDSVPFYGALHSFIPVMAQRQGFKIEQVQVEQMAGRFNYSLHLRDYIRRFLDLISVLFLRNYTKKPLHFLGFIGAIFALVGTGINIYLFFYRLFGIGGIAGKPLLLLGMMLFILGIQMISIGLLGEMIIFTHAREIKDYNIEEIIN